MAKSAAQANTAQNIHGYVAGQIKELRGTMPTSDFAAKSGVHHAEISRLEAGEPIGLEKLRFIAKKNGCDVGFFFPKGRVPKDYPSH